MIKQRQGGEGMPRPRWKNPLASLGLGPVRLATWLAAEVAERTDVPGARLLCGARRTYLGDWPGEQGRHGQNGRSPRSGYSISNWPDKPLGAHPLNWLSARSSAVRLERLANSRRYLPTQPVPHEVQRFQVGEVGQLRRYLPAQLGCCRETAIPGW